MAEIGQNNYCQMIWIGILCPGIFEYFWCRTYAYDAVVTVVSSCVGVVVVIVVPLFEETNYAWETSAADGVVDDVVVVIGDEDVVDVRIGDIVVGIGVVVVALVVESDVGVEVVAVVVEVLLLLNFNGVHLRRNTSLGVNWS